MANSEEPTASVERVEPILQFFKYGHLPHHLAVVSAPFAALAARLVVEVPRNPERTIALRKLLEAKDAAVRARIFVDGSATAAVSEMMTQSIPANVYYSAAADNFYSFAGEGMGLPFYNTWRSRSAEFPKQVPT